MQYKTFRDFLYDTNYVDKSISKKSYDKRKEKILHNISTKPLQSFDDSFGAMMSEFRFNE